MNRLLACAILFASFSSVKLQAQTASAPPPFGLPRILFDTDSQKSGPPLPNSSTWIWDGRQYVGSWTLYINTVFYQATGQMKVTSLEGGHLVIQRTDDSGFLKGITVNYAGDWDGNKIINGTGSYFFNGARGDILWNATREPQISAEEAAKLFLSGPDPTYPMMSRASHATGTARLEFTIRPDGSVGDVKNLDPDVPSLTLFAATATDAISHSKYRPYLSGGQPIAVRTTVSYKFNLASGTGVERLPK